MDAQDIYSRWTRLYYFITLHLWFNHSPTPIPKENKHNSQRETNKRDNKRINDLSILTTENNDTHRHTYQVSRRKTIRNPTKEKQTNLKEERLIIRREREEATCNSIHNNKTTQPAYNNI
jgi:hypothetical protein